MSLTVAYQSELKRTRAAVADALKQHWLALPDYRDGQVEKFVARAVPIVEAGQRRAVAMTDAFMAKSLGMQPIGLQAVDLVGSAVRRGVDPAIVYARPFTTVWTSIGAIGFEAAVQKGLSRLTSTAEMDVALSARSASQAFGDKSGRVAGYMRQAEAGCCDFCTMLDGVKVASADAAPLHNRCPCTVVGIEVGSADAHGFETFSPGTVFKGVRIEEHGELGSLITDKADEFTSEADLPSHYKRMLAQAGKDLATV